MDMSYAGDLRVSDAEREPVIERLQQAFAEGRLEHDEFDMRMHLAMTAKTRSELSGVLHDLEPQAAKAAAIAPAGEPTGEERVLAALSHGVGIPTLFLGPLVMMLWKGKHSQYVRAHAVEALNFQLTVLLVTIVTFGIGGMLYAVTWIVAAVAAVFALSGQPFRHPWILRMMK